jgi:hypothetical protein
MGLSLTYESLNSRLSSEPAHSNSRCLEVSRQFVSKHEDYAANALIRIALYPPNSDAREDLGHYAGGPAARPTNISW